MSSFQRMVVIPQEEYTQLTTVQNARQPLTQQFYNLESEYKNTGFIQDPYRKLMLQSETLEDMKELKDKMGSYLTVSTPKPYVHVLKHYLKVCNNYCNNYLNAIFKI